MEEHLRRLDEAQRERRQRLDLLGYQSRELAEANPKVGEDDELEAERLLLLHGEKLLAATAGGYETLYGEDGAVCAIHAGMLDGLVEGSGTSVDLLPFTTPRVCTVRITAGERGDRT